MPNNTDIKIEDETFSNDLSFQEQEEVDAFLAEFIHLLYKVAEREHPELLNDETAQNERKKL